MRVLDLFSGIGGFALGLQWAGGYETVGFCEIDKVCRAKLAAAWPGVWIHDDVRTLTTELVREQCGHVDMLCGGDPCPAHSKARSNGAAKHPDLSGYFLALVGGLRPRWVVRENVPAPTVSWFDCAMGSIGYGTVVIRMDAANLTGQSRIRDFVVGCRERSWEFVAECFRELSNTARHRPSRLGSQPYVPCLTTHRTRYDSRDCYVWEPGRGLRILDGDERCAVAGFPDGWLDGASEAACAKRYGNSVVPAVVCAIGRAIRAADESVATPGRRGGVNPQDALSPAAGIDEIPN